MHLKNLLHHSCEISSPFYWETNIFKTSPVFDGNNMMASKWIKQNLSLNYLCNAFNYFHWSNSAGLTTVLCSDDLRSDSQTFCHLRARWIWSNDCLQWWSETNNNHTLCQFMFESISTVYRIMCNFLSMLLNVTLEFYSSGRDDVVIIERCLELLISLISSGRIFVFRHPQNTRH